MNQQRLIPFPRASVIAAAILSFTGSLHAEDSWWDKKWTQRQQIVLDGAEVSAPLGETAVLVRLSEGRFNFTAARQDGSDLRFVAADDKTVLPHHVETYDGLLNEAFVWVGLKEVKPGEKQSFYIYYGNQDAAMPAAGNTSDTYSDGFAVIHHFNQGSAAPADATANKNNAEAAAAVAESSVIGSGLRLFGNNPVTIPASDTLAWTQGQDLTIQMWIKPAALQPNAVLFSRADENASLRLILDQGVLIAEVSGPAGRVRSEAATPIAAATWSHLALIAKAGELQLLVNGQPYSTVAGVIPAINGPLVLGALKTAEAGLAGFTGELDEFRVSPSALTPAALAFAVVNQGLSDASQRVVSLGELEGGSAAEGNATLEHIMLFGDIAKNMMFDGWVAVGVCVIMIVIGWTVAIRKFVYLNRIEKGNKEFLILWKSISTDLTALDHADAASIRSMGGSVEEEDQELMKDSPLYQIYHIGSEEISHRLNKMTENNKIEGLPGRSIQAIRASLDAGLIHENHRLTDGLVYLTISIAGGPYVGLLGTVVGVMITFAIIAKSGEVNVNSIAPGIASALLATVAGLVVAIPALFIYSYLNNRIKNVVSSMQVFIDEFVAKMAEFYRPQNDKDVAGTES